MTDKDGMIWLAGVDLGHPTAQVAVVKHGLLFVSVVMGATGGVLDRQPWVSFGTVN